MGEIKVLVVDDHEFVRKGIIAYLTNEADIQIIGEGKSGREAVELAKRYMPDVILMDLLMEDGTGIEATKQVVEERPETKIIILTSYYDESQVIPALEAGAFSYLLKTTPAAEVLQAVRKAYRGENVVESLVTKVMMNRFLKKTPQLHDDLTERELEVLICLAEGMTNQNIAEELFIGVKTVKTYVSNILSKLQVNDRTQAAIYAHRNGLVKI